MFKKINYEEKDIIDEMIAGICISRGATLVTKNVTHFSRIKRLKIEMVN